MTLFYFAQPIDQRYRSPRMTRLRSVALASCRAAKLDLYTPAQAFDIQGALNPSTAEHIDSTNSHALRLAAGLVAVLPSAVPTLGVPTEIETALGQGKPVAIFTDTALRDGSVQLQAWERRGALVLTLHEAEADPAGVLDLLGRHFGRVRLQARGEFMPYVRSDLLASHPSRAYPDDAGLDLAACENVTVPAGGRALVRTGLRFALPPGTWGLIVGRSSTWAKRQLFVHLGVIDAGWRGELFVSVENRGDDEAKVEVGERLAQYVVLPAWSGQLVETDELSPHPRGENGFGSSGR